MRKLWVIVCVLLGLPPALADDVWVPPKRTFHAAFSYTQAFWDEFLQSGSAISLPGEISQYEFTTFLEYVPMENLSIDLTFPIVLSQRKFVFLEVDPMGQIIGVRMGPNGEIRDVDNNGGLGDMYLGAKYIPWTKWVSLGVRPYLKIPGTYAAGDVINAPGDGQLDMGLGFLIGRYFTPIRTYFRASLALVYRAGEPANQMEILIEPGVHITKTLAARFIYEHIDQFGGTDIVYYGLPNDYTAVEEDADRIGFGLSYKASNLFGVFAAYQQTIAGRNTGNTKAFTLGVDFSF